MLMEGLTCELGGKPPEDWKVSLIEAIALWESFVKSNCEQGRRRRAGALPERFQIFLKRRAATYGLSLGYGKGI